MAIFQKILRYCSRYMLHVTYGAIGLFSTRKNSSGTVNQSVKRIHHMDEALPEDIEDVLEISAIFKIREFDVFSLGYVWWFGRNSSSEVLESHFVRYMFNKIVPHWVRHYSRMVIALRLKGELDRETLGIDKLPDATPKSIRKGLRYTVIVFSILALLILLAELAMACTSIREGQPQRMRSLVLPMAA